MKEARGLDNIKIVRELPDGGRLVAFDMGGIRKTIILDAFEEAAQELAEVPFSQKIPMLFSGCVIAPVVRRDAAGVTDHVEVMLSDQTLRRLVGYANNPDWRPTKRAKLERFTVPYGPAFADLMPMSQVESQFYSQYHGQLPTWYSGAMAQVVQVSAGYGSQGAGAGIEDQNSVKWRMETARMTLPWRVAQAIDLELGENLILPAYKGVPPRSGMIQFDFHYNRSHVISFDSENKPWLVEISGSGVWAMPLPMIPATTTRAFRAYIEEVGDQEIIEILNLFGGMPSGEGFPEKGREDWRKAGAIVKVCDDGGFYGRQGEAHFAYANACGWSVNSRGTEGYNTCFTGNPDNGHLWGLAYKMRLRMNPADAGARLPAYFRELDADGALTFYLKHVAQAVKGEEARAPIRYKLRRMDRGALQSRIRSFNPDRVQAEVEYLTELVLPPVAQHSGSIREVSRGRISASSVKFPEPLSDGGVNFNYVSALGEKRPASAPTPSDTIVFGYYAGNSLKVLRQTRDDRTFYRETENTYVGNPRVGTWDIKTYTGYWGIAGGLYSSDFDYREELGGSREHTHIRGHDLGWDKHLRYISSGHPVIVAGGDGILFAVRWYYHEGTKESKGREQLFVGAAVPYFCRDALLFAHSKWGEQKSVVRQPMLFDYVYGPQIGVRYEVVWSKYGWLQSASGQRYGYTYKTVGKEKPSEDLEGFATTGPVLPPPSSDITELIMALPVPPAELGWAFQYVYTEEKKGGSVPTVRYQYSSEVTPGKPEGVGDVEASDADGLRTVAKDVNVKAAYEVESPDPETGLATFYAAATRNTIGRIRYAAYTPGAGPTKVFGYSALVGDRKLPFFIGVINE